MLVIALYGTFQKTFKRRSLGIGINLMYTSDLLYSNSLYSSKWTSCPYQVTTSPMELFFGRKRFIQMFDLRPKIQVILNSD